MSEPVARAVLLLAGAYLALGVAFAAAFVTRGVQRLDPAACGAGLGFRLLVLPGSAALWPLLLARWARGAAVPPAERNAHDAAADAAPSGAPSGGPSGVRR